ncbi:hypothetical protein FOVG_19815 [Fusarium oxysporum f. sp. pisi HDV247]|uniref:Secreted in xylem 1 n=2 Tax=Fusarium oxysporum f. sp. pisi TaxID=179143 RepID=W9N771_FUSOX|nr:hypothetical protein FOVG_19815 [Fusarium oxysporum f. sp. pisi HDV247]QNA42573.1 secreted in xylem 1 [Fusarium oxysporum f. sp. pisi]QNA42575.1 secreted in xylem 1 [Fusarium oxysporum f. sp. pisi]
MAPYSMVLLGTLSIFGFAAYAQDAAVREPQIFFNLTYTEHLAKVAASSGGSVPDNSDLPWDDTMSSFPWNGTDDGNQTEAGSSLSRRGRIFKLGKRDPVGGESRNDAVTNDMLQALHDLCVDTHGTGWRASYGWCSGQVRDIACGRPDTPSARRDIRRPCPNNWECTTFQAINFRSRRATFPVCGPRIKVEERHDIGRHTEYEGTWYPESPKTPGYYNDFAALSGTQNANFDFTGVYSDGQTMHSRGYARSWSCIECPGGKLTITSTAGRTWAIGYTSPN